MAENQAQELFNFSMPHMMQHIEVKDLYQAMNNNPEIKSIVTQQIKVPFYQGFLNFLNYIPGISYFVDSTEEKWTNKVTADLEAYTQKMISSATNNYANYLGKFDEAVKEISFNPSKFLPINDLVNYVVKPGFEAMSKINYTVDTNFDLVVEPHEINGHIVSSINPVRRSTDIIEAGKDYAVMAKELTPDHKKVIADHMGPIIEKDSKATFADLIQVKVGMQSLEELNSGNFKRDFFTK